MSDNKFESLFLRKKKPTTFVVGFFFSKKKPNSFVLFLEKKKTKFL